MAAYPTRLKALDAALQSVCNRVQAKKVKLDKIITDAGLALKCLERRTHGFSPWRDLGLMLTNQCGKEVYCRLSDLPESWQRQILQAAVEAVKSHINLDSKVEEQRDAWLQSQKELFSRPEHERYLAVRPWLQAAIGGSKAQMHPVQFLRDFRR